MGRKLDALLGRKFKTPKFKATVNLAISRLSVLKNQRRARRSEAHCDVTQLLKLNHHEHALLRVDQVIKEQNMLDVFVLIEGYCHLLIQRVNLIEQEKDCPDELKEAASSLLYAALRCGEFPELQEIRAILTARFGKEFAYAATELRNNCGVSQEMIQKLSHRQSNLESRMKMLKEIANENGIALQEEVSHVITEEKLVVEQNPNQPKPESFKVEDDTKVLHKEIEEVLSFSKSMKERRKYRDVAEAAQAAFESAAYAAAAARAAVELSRSESFDSDHPDSPSFRPRKVLNTKPTQPKLQVDEKNNTCPKSESESEYDASSNTDKEGFGGSDEGIIRSSHARESEPFEKKMVFDESEDEIDGEHIGFPLSGNYEQKRDSYGDEIFDSGSDYSVSEGGNGREASPKAELGPGNPEPRLGEGSKMRGVQLNLEKRPISVRTRQVYGR